MLPRARYISAPSFKKDKSGFYYSKLTEQGPRAYYHAMGTDAAQDVKIFGDGYALDKILAVDISEDGRYLVFTIFYGSSCDRSELYFQDLKTGGPIVPVATTVDGCFQGSIADDTLYMQTNWKAPKWRVLAVPLATPTQEHWKEIIPEGESRMEGFRLVGGKIVAQYSHNAASELKIFQPDGKAAGGDRAAATGIRGGNYGEMERERGVLFISIVRDTADGVPLRREPRRHWKRGRNQRCRLTRVRSR